MTEFTTWRSLVDGAEISAIPDSALLYWQAGSFAEPWPDDALGRDMIIDGLTQSTVNDTTVVSNTGDNTGSADVSEFLSELENGVAVEFPIKPNDDNADILGALDDGRFAIGHGDTSTSLSNGTSGNGIVIEIRDESQQSLRVQADEPLPTDQLTDVVVNIGSTDGINDLSILYDGVSQSLVNTEDNNLGDITINKDFEFYGTDGNDKLESDIAGFAFHDETLSEGTIM